MLRKYLLPILCCLCPLAGFSQTTPTHTAQLDSLLKRAYAAAELSFQQASSQQGSSQLATKKPWQLALFLAARQRSLQETLNEIYPQIRQGNISVATVLDVTPDGPVNVKKCVCTKNTCTSKGGLKTASNAVLYVLYRQGNKIEQVKQIVPVSANYIPLWQVLLKHLKKEQAAYYTGILIDAHASGYNFFYGSNDHTFSAQQLVQTLAKQQVHVDFMELHSCHMASLLNEYQWARSANIDYVASSSDICTSSYQFMYYRFLHFLSQPPAQVAVNSVKDRLKQFHFSGTSTNNASAINVKALKRPLLEYVRLYKELLSYQHSEVYENQFDNFFQDDYDWNSLADIVWKQKEFVRSRMDPQLDALYKTQQQFVAACDNLLKALKQSTLTQWCYSQQDNRVYEGRIPPNSGCLNSVSTVRAHYWQLWD